MTFMYSDGFNRIQDFEVICDEKPLQFNAKVPDLKFKMEFNVKTPEIAQDQVMSMLSKIKCGDWKVEEVRSSQYETWMKPEWAKDHYPFEVILKRICIEVYSGVQTYIKTMVILYPSDFESNMWLERIYHCICDAEIHEVGEMFLYGEDRMFNPHKRAA